MGRGPLGWDWWVVSPRLGWALVLVMRGGMVAHSLLVGEHVLDGKGTWGLHRLGRCNICEG